MIALFEEPPQLWQSGTELLKPIFGDSVYTLLGTLMVLPALFFLMFTQNTNSPPKFSIIAPLLRGTFKMAETGPCGLIAHGYKALGGVFRLRLLHQHVSVFVGPEAQAVFFSANDTELSQREVYGFTVPVFGKGIVYDAPLKVMTQQLKFVSKGLTGANMQAHCGKIIEEAEAFFAQWPDQGEVNLMTALSELTILTASRCLLGNEIRNTVHTEFAELYQQLSDGMSHLSFFLPHFPSAAHRKRDEARSKIHAIFSKVINERRATGAQGNTDFLQVILDARYKDGREVSTDEAVGLLLAGLFAGQHTSNITGTWLGLLVLKAKGLVPRILKEQEEVLAASGGAVTLDALTNMTLLNACMKETLRMYPPLIMLMRKALVDIDVGGYTVPRGDICVTCPPVANRLAEVYQQPDAFDPDRFLAPREEDKQAKYSFISFGGGRHGCLGEKFAFLQTKTIWSLLFRTFDFEPMEKEMPLPDYSAIVVGPRPEKCMMRFKRKVPRGKQAPQPPAAQAAATK